MGYWTVFGALRTGWVQSGWVGSATCNLCAEMKVASGFRDSRLSTPPGECSVAECSLHAPAEQKAGFAQGWMQTLFRKLLAINV